MDAARQSRRLPPRVLGALGPRMIELAGAAADGVHTYFMPVAHTASVRSAIGRGSWLTPSHMVALGVPGRGWRDAVRSYLGLCLGMANYRQNLLRSGLTGEDLDTASDTLVDAVVVPDEPAALRARICEQRAAGADQVVLQFVPPPPAATVLDRIAAGWPD